MTVSVAAIYHAGMPENVTGDRTICLLSFPAMSLDRGSRELMMPLLRDSVCLRERIADALARIMLEADDALVLLDEEEANEFLWLEPHVRKIFEDVNAVMFRVTQ
ncbi:MAG: hypothetical protein ACRD3J_01980 [Thermoanaerobaculia bacterium]